MFSVLVLLLVPAIELQRINYSTESQQKVLMQFNTTSIPSNRQSLHLQKSQQGPFVSHASLTHCHGSTVVHPIGTFSHRGDRMVSAACPLVHVSILLSWELNHIYQVAWCCACQVAAVVNEIRFLTGDELDPDSFVRNFYFVHRHVDAKIFVV